jgi:hypothetical protein
MGGKVSHEVIKRTLLKQPIRCSDALLRLLTSVDY